MTTKPDRIGSRCWYLPRVTKDNNEWKGGTLRAWSIDYETESGNANHRPVGIIEDDTTLVCYSIYVENISFAALPPTWRVA